MTIPINPECEQAIINFDMSSRLYYERTKDHDSRSPWEKDLSRLVHSASFRRLQAKTQVLGLGESDFYRTRLTHSMEVAQISSGIIKHLCNQKENSKKNLEILPDTSLMVAISLAHDLGHPPFGHGGEIALNYCMQDYGGFEGNAQTLRILTYLEKSSVTEGLNPTRRLLLGVLKYPAVYEDVVTKTINPPSSSQKPNWLFKSKCYEPPKCIYKEEASILEFILDPFSNNDKKLFTTIKHIGNDKSKHKKSIYKSLDTSIMELADDIAYSIHDLEDAIFLKMITENDWRDHFEKDNKKKFIDNCENNDSFPYNFETLTHDLFGESRDRKKAIGSLVHSLIVNTHIKDLNQKPHIDFENKLLRYNVVITDQYEDMRSNIFKLVVNKMIKNNNVQQLEFKGQKIITELFDVLSSDPIRFIPSLEENSWKGLSDREKHRNICDYIAGMTDNYAIRQYEKLLVPNRGSIFEFL